MTTLQQPRKITKLLVRLPKELHQELKILAVRTGRPMQDIVESAVKSEIQAIMQQQAGGR